MERESERARVRVREREIEKEKKGGDAGKKHKGNCRKHEENTKQLRLTSRDTTSRQVQTTCVNKESERASERLYFTPYKRDQLRMNTMVDTCSARTSHLL